MGNRELSHPVWPGALLDAVCDHVQLCISIGPDCSMTWDCAVLQVQLQQKRAEADSIAPYSRSFGRTLVSSILAAEGGLGLVSLTQTAHLPPHGDMCVLPTRSDSFSGPFRFGLQRQRYMRGAPGAGGQKHSCWGLGEDRP